MYLAYLFHSIAFLVVLEILNVTCKEFYTDKMSDLQGVFRKNLSVTVGTAITFLSFSSIPPFLGFFSKISLLILLLNMGNVLLVMSLVGLTLITNFYY
jgi:NADH-quinone oxidoreductase subunit N